MIMTTQPGAPADLRVWCKKAGHEYLGQVEEAGYRRHFVRKAG
jgi:tRNA 2-thiouridine synthesizing protein A